MQAEAITRRIEIPLPFGAIASGCRFRVKRQISVLAGQAASVTDVVGSVRGLSMTRGILAGDLRWASDEAAQAVRAKYLAGHLELSLRVSELEYCDLKHGETLAGITGPARVFLTWQPTSMDLIPARRPDDR